MRDQPVRSLPGLFVGFAHDQVQADAETQLPPDKGRAAAHIGDFFRHLRGRLAPGEIQIGLLGRELVPRRRGAADIKRRMRRLHRGKHQPATLDAQVAPIEIDGFALHQAAPDTQELGRLFVAFVVAEEDAVAGEVGRIAADNDVEQQAATAKPVESGGLAGGLPHRRRARAQGDQEFKPLGVGDDRGAGDPGILAATAGRDQHAEIAEPVGGLGYFPQVAVAAGAPADGRAEMGTIAAGGEKPEEIEGTEGGHGGMLDMVGCCGSWCEAPEP